MSFENTKVLEFNQCQKSNKAALVIHADLACFIENFDGCKNNSKNSFTTKVGEHILSGFPMSTIP